MTSTLDPPHDDWWGRKINRRESIRLGLSGIWSIGISGWMSAFTRIGDQNPIGETLRISAERYQEKMQSYKDAADQTDDGLVPAASDVFIPGLRYNWDGTPVVLETGMEHEVYGHTEQMTEPTIK